MDEDTEQLGRILLEADFQFGLNVVHLGKRKIVRHGAMTRDVHAAAHALDDEVVHVEHLGKVRRYDLQPFFEFRVADNFFGRFNGGRFALDVGNDVCDLREFTAHIGFQFRNLIVRVFQFHALVEFDVLFDVHVSSKILHADVVDVEVPLRGGGTNAIEDVLRTLSARKWLHGHIGVRKNLVHGLSYGSRQLAGALEGHGASQSHGEVGEKSIASPPNPNAIHFEDAINAQDGIVNLGPHARRGGVEKGVHGAASESPTYRNHDPGHEEGGNGIGISEPFNPKDAPNENQPKTEYDHAGGPNVGGEMECVGFERLTVVFGRNAAEHPGAPPVESHREHHHCEGSDGRLDVDPPKKEAQRRFVNDPSAGQQQEPGFDECRKVFDLAVAVLMVGICGLIGDSN